MNEREYTPHQRKIIQRYYEHQPQILRQRLSELVGDLFLAEGKKRRQLWTKAADCLRKLGVPEDRIDRLVAKDNPANLAAIVQEIESKK
jgi:hypothetical protein